MPAIPGSIVVITGASSGIGRSTALTLAERGATLVLSARRQWALEEVARECEARGAHTLVVPADVTAESQVREIARRAVETFGRIDVWINGAAVSLFGSVLETPIDAYRRVMDINFYGVLHGTRAVLPYMIEQGSGIIINIDSAVSDGPEPNISAYGASKAAVHHFSASVRMELAQWGERDIHVCTLLPPAIDTPLFRTTANYTGHEIRPIPPLHDPAEVAGAIMSLIERPRRSLRIGIVGLLAPLLQRVSPPLYEQFGGPAFHRAQSREEPEPATNGNLWEPAEEASVTGGWRQDGGLGTSTVMLRSTLRVATFLLAAGLATGAVAAFSRMRGA